MSSNELSTVNRVGASEHADYIFSLKQCTLHISDGGCDKGLVPFLNRSRAPKLVNCHCSNHNLAILDVESISMDHEISQELTITTHP